MLKVFLGFLQVRQIDHRHLEGQKKEPGFEEFSRNLGNVMGKDEDPPAFPDLLGGGDDGFRLEAGGKIGSRAGFLAAEFIEKLCFRGGVRSVFRHKEGGS